jgi:RNA recognition motif-containing protein
MDPILPSKRSSDRAPEDGLLKKAKMDPRSNTEYEATRVLFVRGLPSSVSEAEIAELCCSVGIVEQVFLMRNKGQAFVEFDSQEAADFCLLHFTRNAASLEGSRLFFSYSGRQQVTRKPQDPPKPSNELLLKITDVKYPVTSEILERICSPHGTITNTKIFPRSFGFQIIITFDSLEAAEAAKKALDGQHIYRGCNIIEAGFSPMKQLVTEKKPEVSDDDNSNVLFLHNMSDHVTPEMLFNLFSLYGNVMRVKVFFKRRDMALVQYEDHTQAETAKHHLHNLPLYGRTMLVSISRNSFIDTPGRKAALCRDYTDSPFHRYKIAGSKNFQHMFPPATVVHLSNLSENMDEDFFHRLFADTAQLVGFKFLGEDRRMALAKFKTVEDAAKVLAVHHNSNIKGRFLKVAFSKATF